VSVIPDRRCTAKLGATFPAFGMIRTTALFAKWT
jgi:hypothetical protein